MAATNYDMVVIGGGQAGVPVAHALAKAGQRVALVEGAKLGGSCVNFGCTPTKAVLASAKVAHQARRGADYGLRIPTIEVDFPAVLERARHILLQSRAELEQGLEGAENPKLIRGYARLAGRDGTLFRIHAGNTELLSKQVVLNTGTRSVIPQIDGLDGVAYLDAENWLDQPTLPEHLVIMGGGYIGLEMGQFYRRMGSRVTVVEAGGQVASHEDEDVAAALQRLLAQEGITFRLNTKIQRVRRRNAGVTVDLDGAGEASDLKASHLFVATGRRSNTDDLGLETVGVALTDDGEVKVDNRLATNVPGIWAAGDIRGGPMFTHTSWDDYRVLESQLVGDRSRTTDRIIPYAIFTDPQLGRVGMTEREARETKAEVKTGMFEMRNSSKAIELGETGGFIKVIVDGETEQLLGAAVLAVEGAELVHAYIDLMYARAPYTVIRDAIHIHPTLAEDLQSAVATIG